MRALPLILTATALALLWGEPTRAQDDDPGEKRAAQMIRNRTTGDGSSVAQVISYVAKRRPGRFTFSQISATRLAKGGPYDVFVCFYNGAQRDENHEDCATSYTVSLSPAEVTISGDEKSNPAHALERGKDAFLSAVDREYKEYCGDKRPEACRSSD